MKTGRPPIRDAIDMPERDIGEPDRCPGRPPRRAGAATLLRDGPGLPPHEVLHEVQGTGKAAGEAPASSVPDTPAPDTPAEGCS